MNKLFLISMMATGMAWAGPTVKVTQTAWDDALNAVKVDYAVEGDSAVVTFSVKKGGAAVSDAEATRLTGDVNRLVAAGEHSFAWYPQTVWPKEKLASGDLQVVLTAWATDDPPPYMVIDLESKESVRYYATKEAFPGGFDAKVYKTGKLVMRRIPAKGVKFRMGRTSADASYENYYFKSTETSHEVSFTSDFYLAVYETTQAQHAHVTGALPKRAPWAVGGYTDAHPVEALTCYGEAENHDGIYGYIGCLRRTEYCWPEGGHKVSDASVIGQFRALTGVELDLPTESQWEYACRAGTDTVYYDGSFCPTNIAWGTYLANKFGFDLVPTGTQEVGLLQPNAWDLYDMSGNVAEPCLDVYAAQPSYVGDEIDPKGPANPNKSSRVVIRGGGWSSRVDWYARSAWRGNISNGTNYGVTQEIGYRLYAPAEAVK